MSCKKLIIAFVLAHFMLGCSPHFRFDALPDIAKKTLLELYDPNFLDRIDFSTGFSNDELFQLAGAITGHAPKAVGFRLFNSEIYLVLLRSDFAAEDCADIATLAHEVCHCAQGEADGVMFFVRYLFEYRGVVFNDRATLDVYHAHPFETACRERELQAYSICRGIL